MAQYRCRKCKTGLLKPVVEDNNETEVSEIYLCDRCGYKATIPSVLIITSQLLTSTIGGLISAFLLVEQLSILVTTLQFNIVRNLSLNLGLLSLALIFVLGFGYTLYVGFQGLARRRLYLSAERRVHAVPAEGTSDS